MFLEANPDYYDYNHRIILNSNGRLDLYDACGQSINFEAKIDYSIEYKDQYNGILRIDNINDISNKHFKFKIEYGTYILAEARCWNLKSIFNEKLLIYKKRYIFETDPLKLGTYILNNNKRELSECIYYDRNEVIMMTRNEWLKKGNIFNDSFSNTYNLKENTNDPLRLYVEELSTLENKSKNLELFDKISNDSKNKNNYDNKIIDKIACHFSKNGHCISICLTRWYEINNKHYAYILIYCSNPNYNDDEFIKKVVCYYQDAFIFDNDFDYKHFKELIFFEQNDIYYKDDYEYLNKYKLSDKNVMYCKNIDL